MRTASMALSLTESLTRQQSRRPRKRRCRRCPPAELLRRPQRRVLDQLGGPVQPEDVALERAAACQVAVAAVRAQGRQG